MLHLWLLLILKKQSTESFNGLAKILKAKFHLTVTIPRRRLVNNPEEMLTTL